MCRGARDQLELDKHELYMIERLSPQLNDKNQAHLCSVVQDLERLEDGQHNVPEEEAFLDNLEAWDDVNGEQLDPTGARKARLEEVEYVRKVKLYDKVPIRQCYDRTGKAPMCSGMRRPTVVG